MSKVLVDRELLESLAELGEDAINRMGSYLAEKHGEQRYVDAARAILAKPAEAEGVVAWAPSTALEKLRNRHNNAPCVLTDGPAEFNDVPLVTLAALSAERARADVAVADANDAERALVAAPIAQTAPQQPAECTNEDSWNCKYCRKTEECQAIKDHRNFGAPIAQTEQQPVAYLDLGIGGYMDLGTDLTDEQLKGLPWGRHMLGIIRTYGADGYVPAAPIAQADPQSEFGDAYQGAREDLAIWKRRALGAEQKVRQQEQIIDHLTLEAQGETRMGEPLIPQTAPQPEQSGLVLPRAQLERIERRLTDWLELNCCECESGHSCGRSEVAADRDAIRAALSAPVAQTALPTQGAVEQ